MENVLLYHGSRGGIQGDIRPNSRPRCDFGQGFYMGTNPLQAKSLVASDTAPYFYVVNLRHLKKWRLPVFSRKSSNKQTGV